jgi:hypothetical protein
MGLLPGEGGIHAQTEIFNQSGIAKNNLNYLSDAGGLIGPSLYDVNVYNIN